MLKNKKDVFIIGFFFLALVLLAYSFFHSMPSIPEEKEAAVLTGPAEDWLDAVADQDADQAIALAEDISADIDSYSMPEAYVGLCEDNGIAPNFWARILTGGTSNPGVTPMSSIMSPMKLLTAPGTTLQL